ncbi:MAG: DUF1540 domain-containing protein [Clostridia bacterium]|nr:DUF1540 domain-containing protein [Clostridia bacterium]
MSKKNDLFSGVPEHVRDVHCDVTSCAYHDGTGFCTANEIKIGPSYAVSSTQTVCATYRPRYVREI